MAEYSMARTIPTGWEGITVKRDTRSFWRGVEAEVTRLGIVKTDLAAVKAVADRHIAFEAWFLTLPASFRKTLPGTKTVAGVTQAITLTAKYADGNANIAVLDAVEANDTVVHVIGTDFKVGISAAADADAGASREYTVTIVEA